MSSRIKLPPNEPVIVRLLDPFADSAELWDGERRIGEYRTVDGRILALPRPAVIVLNDLDAKQGEEIGVCRQRSGEITVWLTASSEKARAEAETAPESPDAPSDEELLLAASLERQEARNARKVAAIRKPARKQDDQPRLFDRQGTGTHGPAPAVQPLADTLPRAAVMRKTTPYGQMLRHIIHTVEQALQAEGLQLGDGPKQDLVSTVYIDAAKRSGIEYDFTEGAE